MLVIPTSLLEEKLKKKLSVCRNRIEKFQQEMSDDERRIDLFERFGSYLKRRFDSPKPVRLFARHIRVDGYDVVCLLDLVGKEEKEYEIIIQDIDTYGKKHWERYIDRDHIRTLIKKTRQPKTKRIQPVPENLRKWLVPPSVGEECQYQDMAVYETTSWRDAFRKKEVAKHWKSYYDLVFAAVEENGEGDSSGGVECTPLCFPDTFLLSTQKNGLAIIFSRLSAAGALNKKALLLLHAFLNSPSIGEAEKEIRPFESILARGKTSKDPTISLGVDDLARVAARSYPAYILADCNAWHAIEMDEEANLALSVEEQEVLISVSYAEPNKPMLPLFINGRAGSGKSTLLMYLFADYCYRRLAEGLEGEPLFLTYNERLSNTAQKNVENILRFHWQFAQRQEQAQELSSAPVKKFFTTFREFLLSRLTPEQQSRFDLEKHIGFWEFKQLYLGQPVRDEDSRFVCRLPETRSIAPELAWHIIRSFIKGRKYDDYLTPGEYSEIPSKEQCVAFDEYVSVYDTIWKKWYSLLTTTDGYWDDQDLARTLVGSPQLTREFPVVFCDEAQDFTRLELKLIMRIFAFAQYDLSHELLRSLPFAFAGDPCQTLNPSGFRWSSTKAAFYDEIIRALDPDGLLNLRLNYTELTHNYRSTSAIVRFCNLIQLWRHVYLDFADLKAQKSWRHTESLSPQLFILGKNFSESELVVRWQNTIIIVPCDEGAESEYVANDAALSKLIKVPRGYPPKNVLSPAAAKGLEWDRVILYKFGEACPDKVFETNGAGTAVNHKGQYFLNKLYVAASRARRYLFIIDTEDGYNRIWMHGESEKNMDKCLKLAKRLEDWNNLIGGFENGSRETSELMNEQDAVGIARQFERRGEEQENADLLFRAALYFRDSGLEQEAMRCDAKAYHFEKKYRAAGDLFRRLNMFADAADSYWLGLCWSELLDCCEKTDNGERGAVASFMTSEDDDLNALEIFGDFLGERIGNDQIPGPLSKPWAAAIEAFRKRVALALDHDRPLRWDEYGRLLDSLHERGYPEMLSLSARCFFRGRTYDRAAQTWERAGQIDHADYFVAKGESLGYPECLPWFARASLWDKVLNEWERHDRSKRRLDPSEMAAVGQALEAKSRWEDAFEWCRDVGLLEEASSCLRNLAGQLPSATLWRRVHTLLKSMTESKAFAPAVDAWFSFAVDHEASPGAMVAAGAEIVEALAYSSPDDFDPLDLTPEENRRIAEFFERLFMLPGWRDKIDLRIAGAAIEKVGLFRSAFLFYERLMAETDKADEVRFAQERWIATKDKQIAYYRRRGESDAYIMSLLQERGLRCEEWGIPDNIELSPYPDLSRMFQWRQWIKGLPAEAEVESSGKNDVRIRLGDLEIRAKRDVGLVLLTNNESLSSVRVDLRERKITGDDVKLDSPRAECIEFESPSTECVGSAMWTGGRSKLELKIGEDVIVFNL